jgi:hypothetical protein
VVDEKVTTEGAIDERGLGWYPFALRAIVRTIKWPIDQLIGTPFVEHHASFEYVEARVRKADILFATLLVFDVVSILCLALRGRASSLELWWVPVVYLAWRIVDIMATALQLTLFSPATNHAALRAQAPHLVPSPPLAME